MPPLLLDINKAAITTSSGDSISDHHCIVKDSRFADVFLSDNYTSGRPHSSRFYIAPTTCFSGFQARRRRRTLTNWLGFANRCAEPFPLPLFNEGPESLPNTCPSISKPTLTEHVPGVVRVSVLGTRRQNSGSVWCCPRPMAWITT